MPFATTGSFGGNNTFTVELSDPAGNFVNPFMIGSGTASPILATIPAGTVPSTSYRVRVLSSNPLAEGEVSPTIVTVTPPPSVTASSNSPNGETALGDTLRLFATASSVGGTSYAWSGPNGFTSNQQNPVIPSSTTAHNGTYTVTLTAPGGCTATAQTSVTLGADTNQVQRTIRIKAVDSTPTETDLLPRMNGGFGTLNLSVEELDGLDLTGYSYLWTEPTGTPAASTSATTTPTLTAGRIGEYKVTLTKGRSDGSVDTLVAYTTLRAKPCRQVAHTYQCGNGPAAPIIDEGSLGLSNLAPGDTIRTGDFDVIVTEVQSGGNGIWTGIGYTEIPYLKGQRIAVEFTGASVNECYEFTGQSGKIQSAYDPSWGGITDIDAAIAQIQDKATHLIGLYAVYTGTVGQKDTIRTVNAELCAAIASNTQLSPTEKDRLLAKCQAYQANAETFLACSTTASGGRLSARVAAGTCSITAEQLASQLDSLQQAANTNATTTSPKPKPNAYVSAENLLLKSMTFLAVGTKSVVLLPVNTKLDIRLVDQDVFSRNPDRIFSFQVAAKKYYGDPIKSGLATTRYIAEGDNSLYKLTPVTAALPEVFTTTRSTPREVAG
ncbi:hypothetical protein BN8_03873 [Fibrisoma limi BUZ 3]|uniref:PKD domain-containing protein n=1 Tax=Fibrisoma limi BUZ 3 TaxID=1185876 RepID=I2GLA1_9BACT|nr:hypothetical protein BN8_03873 [Fibrisoma limi BUZ 3]